MFQDLRFTTRLEVIDWCAANVPQNVDGWQRTVHLRCYDVVNPEILSPNKIWGNNAIYARLKTGTYFSRKSCVTDSDTNWDASAGFLAAAWEKVFGIPHPDAGSWNASSYSTFWFTQKRSTLYRCAYEHTEVGITSDNPAGRHAVDPITGLTDVHYGDLFVFDTNTKIAVALVSPEGEYYRLLQLQEYPKEPVYAAQKKLALEGYSTMLLLGMVDIATGKRSLLLKPAYQDSYWLPWIDINNYRYEYVTALTPGGNPHIDILDPRPSYASEDTMGPWNLKDMSRSRFYLGDMTGGALPNNIQFQVRDLATGEVSPLSNARIRLQGRRKMVQLSAYVENSMVS